MPVCRASLVDVRCRECVAKIFGFPTTVVRSSVVVCCEWLITHSEHLKILPGVQTTRSPSERR